MVIATDNESVSQQVGEWRDVVFVQLCGGYAPVAVKSDGTDVTTDSNIQEMVAWQDIVAIDTCDDSTIGLKSDGSIVATGDYHGIIDDWYDVAQP